MQEYTVILTDEEATALRALAKLVGQPAPHLLTYFIHIYIQNLTQDVAEFDWLGRFPTA